MSDAHRNAAIALFLAALMAVTRYHHFGSAIDLPDASLAVFFLGGLYALGAWFFTAFLAEAALIDYLAIAGGVSSFCVTPAYVFLIPAYGGLWLGGRWLANHHEPGARTLPLLAATLCAGTSLAFLVSNGGFYALSGYFNDLAPTEYAMRVARYYPPYVGYAFLYTGIALAVHAVIAKRLSRAPAAS